MTGMEYWERPENFMCPAVKVKIGMGEGNKATVQAIITTCNKARQDIDSMVTYIENLYNTIDSSLSRVMDVLTTHSKRARTASYCM